MTGIEKGVVIVYKGMRRHLRGRYSDGTCILTPKGFYLWLSGKWHVLVVDQQNTYFNVFTGEGRTAYKFEPINKED